MLVTRKQVESHLGTTTSDQLDRCTPVYDFQLKANIYMVLSESDDLTEYRVTYDQKHKCYCCNCPSGENGFCNVSHPSGVCKHVRWSVAHAQERKAAEQKRLARAVATVQAHSCGMQICSTADCLQLASTTTSKCNQHNGVVSDAGMLAWMADRAAGKDINVGRPAWMMK